MQSRRYSPKNCCVELDNPAAEQGQDIATDTSYPGKPFRTRQSEGNIAGVDPAREALLGKPRHANGESADISARQVPCESGEQTIRHRRRQLVLRENDRAGPPVQNMNRTRALVRHMSNHAAGPAKLGYERQVFP